MEVIKAKIIKCSSKGDWYENMVGETIEVKRTLTTIGAETIEGKKIYFYDLEIQWK